MFFAFSDELFQQGRWRFRPHQGGPRPPVSRPLAERQPPHIGTFAPAQTTPASSSPNASRPHTRGPAGQPAHRRSRRQRRRRRKPRPPSTGITRHYAAYAPETSPLRRMDTATHPSPRPCGPPTTTAQRPRNRPPPVPQPAPPSAETGTNPAWPTCRPAPGLPPAPPRCRISTKPAPGPPGEATPRRCPRPGRPGEEPRGVPPPGDDAHHHPHDRHPPMATKPHGPRPPPGSAPRSPPERNPWRRDTHPRKTKTTPIAPWARAPRAANLAPIMPPAAGLRSGAG